MGGLRLCARTNSSNPKPLPLDLILPPLHKSDPINSPKPHNIVVSIIAITPLRLPSSFAKKLTSSTQLPRFQIDSLKIPTIPHSNNKQPDPLLLFTLNLSRQTFIIKFLTKFSNANIFLSPVSILLNIERACCCGLHFCCHPFPSLMLSSLGFRLSSPRPSTHQTPQPTPVFVETIPAFTYCISIAFGYLYSLA